MQQLLFAPFNKRGKRPTEEQLKAGDYQWQVPQTRSFRVENLSNYVKEGRETALKYRDMEISGFGIAPISFTASGMPQCDTPVIKKLAGKKPSKE